jgi:hypothetical protein
MSSNDNVEQELKHELANAVQQKKALQKLLQSASDTIEELVDGNCEAEAKADALEAAQKFRRAASL